MREIGVRKATDADKEKLVSWLAANAEKNLVDWDVLTYPATVILCAFDRDTKEPLMYMPVQDVFMCESLAPQPELGDLERAKCLEKLLDVVLWDSSLRGRGEVYFPCSDDRLGKVAQERRFAVVNLPVLRTKL